MNEKMEKERVDNLKKFKEMEPWLVELHLGETIVISNGEYIIDNEFGEAIKRSYEKFPEDAHKLVQIITKYEDGELVPKREKCTNPLIQLGLQQSDLDQLENNVREAQPDDVKEVVLRWIADAEGALLLFSKLRTATEYRRIAITDDPEIPSWEEAPAYVKME